MGIEEIIRGAMEVLGPEVGLDELEELRNSIRLVLGGRLFSDPTINQARWVRWGF